MKCLPDMKFLIDLPGPYAEGYKILAKKRGFATRQALVKFVLEAALNQYPEILEAASVESSVKEIVREQNKPWNPPLRPVSDQDMKEIFGDDLDLGLYQGPVAQEPELPEL